MPSKEMNVVPVELVKAAISYDPHTGSLTWRPDFKAPRTFNRSLLGKPAISCLHKTGYLTGHLFGVPVKAHRVAWAIHHGEWPFLFIDHANGDRADNRISNLRVATRSENGRNRKPNENGSSKYLGVSFHKTNKRFQASIRDHGRDYYLGYFDSEEAAAAAYDIAAIEIHGAFASPNFGS